jgi:hypothetical protein
MKIISGRDRKKKLLQVTAEVLNFLEAQAQV